VLNYGWAAYREDEAAVLCRQDAGERDVVRAGFCSSYIQMKTRGL